MAGGRKRKGASRRRSVSDDDQNCCPCGTKGSKYWICCDGCEIWYHGKCADLSERATNAIDKFYCKKCRSENPSYVITYKPLKDKRLKLDTSDPDADVANTSTHNNSCLEEKPAIPIVVEPEPSRYEQQPPSGLPAFIPKEVDGCGNCSGCFRESDCGMCINCHEGRGRCMKKICNKALDVNQRDQRDIENITTELEKAVGSRTPKELFSLGKKQVVPRLKNDVEVVHCNGPNCTKPSRPGSNYCSHECGLEQARKRLLMVLPVRARDYAASCPEGMMQFQKNTQDAFAKYNKYRRNLDYLARVKKFIVDFLEEIHSKKPEVTEESESQKKDDSKPNCFLGRCTICGATFNTYGVLYKHVMRCFAKFERRATFCAPEPELENPENIICDTLCKPQNMYCKRLKILCPDHYKGPYNEKGTLCAAPLYMYDDDFAFDFTTELEDLNVFLSKGYCKLKKENCDRHCNWTQVFLGSVDNFRINLLIKMEECAEMYRKGKREYSKRFDVVEMMQNYRITDKTDKYGMPKDVDFVNDLPDYFYKKHDWSEEVEVINERIQERLIEINEEAERKKEAEKAKKEAEKKTRGRKKVVNKKKPVVKRTRKPKVVPDKSKIVAPEKTVIVAPEKTVIVASENSNTRPEHNLMAMDIEMEE